MLAEMWLQNPDCPIGDKQWWKMSFDCLARLYSQKYLCWYSREYAGLLVYLISCVTDVAIFMCHRHGYPWPSLATFPYCSSPLASLQGYIPYPHIAAVCMFELVVLLLPGHMWGSIVVPHLWARPCFSSSVLHVWFV